MGKKELGLVIEAIAEAKLTTPSAHDVRVYISSNNGLDAIYSGELRDILLKLQDDERILKIKSFPDYSSTPWQDWFESRYPAHISKAKPDFRLPEGSNFTVETFNGFDEWCAGHWQKRKHSSGETSTPVVTRRKPSWAQTNVPWDIKKVIWQKWARGDTIAATQRFFELHAGENKGAPFDKETIQKVRNELRSLPDSLMERLLAEFPEVSSLVRPKG